MRERIKTAEEQIKVLMEDAKTHQDDLVRLVKEMAAVHSQTGTVLVTLSNNMEQLTNQLRSLEVAIIRMEGKPITK
jgi:predicted ATP-grasp superfamily ATP-dependent carboligase